MYEVIGVVLRINIVTTYLMLKVYIVLVPRFTGLLQLLGLLNKDNIAEILALDDEELGFSFYWLNYGNMLLIFAILLEHQVT